MTRSRTSLAAFALALALAPASSVLADGRTSVKADLRDETSLGGTKVPAGKYRISWTANGADAEVQVLQGSKVVATGKGKLVNRDKPATDDEVVSRRSGTGFAMSEIRLRGEKNVLVLQTS